MYRKHIIKDLELKHFEHNVEEKLLMLEWGIRERVSSH